MSSYHRASNSLSMRGLADDRRVADRFLRIAYRINAALENKPMLFLIGLFVIYSVTTLIIAYRKQLWYDELCTYHVAQLPAMRDIWSVLKFGFEQLPPSIHLLIRFSLRVFGDNPVALRLPSILGYWIMCLSLFVFVVRRAPVAFAAIATVFPVIATSSYYATEARPYALVLGSCGIALISWQGAGSTGARRVFALLSLTGSLVFAISCHYFAILMIPCLAVGEMVRLQKDRKPDFFVWLALLSGCLSILIYYDLLQVAFQAAPGRPLWKGRFFWSPVIYKLYQPLLGSVGAVFLAAASVGGLMNPRRCVDAHRGTSFDLAELAVAICLCSLPLLLGLCSSLGVPTNYRYVIVSLLGSTILLVSGLRKVISRELVSLLLIGLLLLSPWCLYQGSVAFNDPARSLPLCLRSSCVSEDTNCPIVLQDGKLLYARYYGVRSLLNRLCMIIMSTDDLEEKARIQDMIRLGHCMNLNILKYDGLIKNKKFFLEIDEIKGFGRSLVTRLTEDGAKLEICGSEDGTYLYKVSMPSG